jgi:hypothetical protein
MDDAIKQLSVEVLPDGRMDRPNAATYIGRSVQTLAVWSMKKIGPAPIRVNGRVYYFKADIDRFIAAGYERRLGPRS